jgi:antitoxin component of MazEF toxin-antitoxin module
MAIEVIDVCRAQKIGDSLYVLLPAQLARRLETNPGDEFQVNFDNRNQTISYKPKETKKHGN